MEVEVDGNPFSSDGGKTWDEQYFEPQLPDPVNQASILDIGEKDGKTILAHSNAADEKERNYLTVKISYDEGKTWSQVIPIDYSDNPEKYAWTAYSDLVNLDERTLGILYERDNYRQIVFKPIQWKN